MKLGTSECINLLTKLRPLAQEVYHVKSMSLFGSTARGDQKEDSDVDILVEMPPKLILVSRFQELLEEKLGKQVDLIRRHSNLSPSFLEIVSRDEISIF